MAMAEHGLADAVKLASNELPWAPLPSVQAAITSGAGGVNRYPDHLARELREALAGHVGLPADSIATGCGSVGLLFQLGAAYVEPGDEVVYVWPSFETYPIVTKLAGATPVPVPLRRQTIDADAVVGAMNERTRLVLLATPNNPTGTALRTDGLRRIAEAAPASCLVVVDEAYHELVTGADVPDTAGAHRDHPNVVTLRTFSKAYGLAALRVGYAIADPEVVSALDRCLWPFAVNGLGQAAALASLTEHAHDELRDVVEQVTGERARVASELRRAGWGVPDAQANFVWLPAGEASVPLFVELEKAGVVTRPFEGVGVRVTVGDFDEGDRFLEAFAEAAPRVGAAVAWRLPVADAARRADAWLDRIDGAVERIARSAFGPPPVGLTEPDAGGEERWDAGQVWAHVGEFGGFWLRELHRVLDDGGRAVPFGRTKKDPGRIAAIQSGRADEPLGHLGNLERSLDGLRALLAELSDEEWGATGRHETLGVMGVERILEEFLVGHVEEHAAQLESLHP